MTSRDMGAADSVVAPSGGLSTLPAYRRRASDWHRTLSANSPLRALDSRYTFLRNALADYTADASTRTSRQSFSLQAAISDSLLARLHAPVGTG